MSTSSSSVQRGQFQKPVHSLDDTAVKQYAPAHLLSTTKYDREVQVILDNSSGFTKLINWIYYAVWGRDLSSVKDLKDERVSIAKVKTTLEELVTALAIAKIMPTKQDDPAPVQKAEERVKRATNEYLLALTARANFFDKQEQAPIFLAGKQEIANRIKDYNTENFANEHGWFGDSFHGNYIPPAWMNTVVSPRLSSDMLKKFGHGITPKVIESDKGLVSIYDQADTYTKSFGEVTDMNRAIIKLRNEARQYHGNEFAEMIEKITSDDYIASEMATKTAAIKAKRDNVTAVVTLLEGEGPGSIKFAQKAQAEVVAPVPTPEVDPKLVNQLNVAKNELAGHINARQLVLNKFKTENSLDLETLSKEIDKDNDQELLTQIAKKLNLPTSETNYENLANATTHIIAAKAQVKKLEDQIAAAKQAPAPKQPAQPEVSVEQMTRKLEEARAELDKLSFDSSQIEHTVTEERSQLAKKLTLFTAASTVSDAEFVELVTAAKLDEIERAAGLASDSAKKAQHIADKLTQKKEIAENVGPGILDVLRGYVDDPAAADIVAEVLDAHKKAASEKLDHDLGTNVGPGILNTLQGFIGDGAKTNLVAQALDAHSKKPQPIEGQALIKPAQYGKWIIKETTKEEPKAATALKNEDIFRLRN